MRSCSCYNDYVAPQVIPNPAVLCSPISHNSMKSQISGDSYAVNFCSLGVALRTAYENSGNFDDLEEATRLHQKAASLCGKTLDMGQSECFLELGKTLLRRFQAKGDTADLSNSIAYQRRALEHCPSDHPSHADTLHGLATVLWMHYRTFGQLSVLQEAIDIHKQALSFRPPGHPERHLSLNGLAIAFKFAFELSGSINDLNVCIKYHREALTLRTIGHPERHKSLSNLCDSYHLRFSVLGDPGDLQMAIDLGQEALAMRPKGHPLRTTALLNLSVAMHSRYRHLGDVGDLEHDIRLKREALDSCLPGHQHHGLCLLNLGDSLQVRFELLSKEEDLRESMDLFRQALQVFPHGHHDHGLATFSLAQVLNNSYEHYGILAYLGEAMNMYGPWFSDVINDSNTDQGEFAYVAGLTYRHHFLRTQDGSSVVKSIAHFTKSVHLRNIGHPRRYRSLHELAVTHRLRHIFLTEGEDADKAITLERDALLILPYNHPDRALVIMGLAHIHLLRGTVYFDPNAAISFLEDALSDANRSPQLRLAEATEVFKSFEELLRYLDVTAAFRTRLLEAYRLALSLLPHVAYFGLDHRSRLRALLKGGTLVSTAATHALLLHKTAIALELLEEGRAVFWTQHLRLRTPFDALPKNLRHELRLAAEHLEVQSSPSSCDGSSNQFKARQEAEAARRRQLGEHFSDLMARARTIPGFDRLGKHDVYASLSQVASHGPVVIILAEKQACHAIIVRSPGKHPEQIFLPDISESRLSELTGTLVDVNRNKRFGLEQRSLKKVLTSASAARDVFEELWFKVVKKIVATLGFRVRTSYCGRGVFLKSFFSLRLAEIDRASGSALPVCSRNFLSTQLPPFPCVKATGLQTLLCRRTYQHWVLC
jgi:tetratricopeptide (TPR) repeat protein